MREFRAATVEEAPAIFKFYDEVVADNTGSTYDVLWRRDLHPSDESLLAALEAGELFVMCEDGELAGAAVMNRDFAQGYDTLPWSFSLDNARCVHLLCTHPDFTGKGMAKDLLNNAADHFRSIGCSGLVLDVFAHNVPARGLYEACGYALVGITNLTYEDQEVCTIDFAMYELTL